MPSFSSTTLIKVDMANVDRNEWEWVDALLEFVYTDARESLLGNQYTRIYCSFKIVRRIELYLWRDIALVSILTLSSLTIFCMHPIDKFSDRVNIGVSLMLAMAAVNYVVQSGLPPVAYLTLMHKFIVASFFFLFFALAETAIFKLAHRGLADPSVLSNIDGYIGIGFVAVWLVVHVVGPYTVKRVRATEMKKLKRTQREIAMQDHGFGNVEANPDTLFVLKRGQFTGNTGKIKDLPVWAQSTSAAKPKSAPAGELVC